MVLPLHLRLTHYPSVCTEEWCPTANTLCPSVFSAKKTQEVSHGYAQNETQKDHLLRISYLWLFQSPTMYHVMIIVQRHHWHCWLPG